ncbi:hypothetical protein Pcinc_038331 [Petrolisthes cinctipes]|uniref:Uncharacterized protein n=1 Tax=Petrolisthes cinctipes TaxID=88211 RepID=A0AAE1EK57_PETCI|nr:hypothetical protein Pcinc_038331 [Petrolisthes cinctipes]
MDLSPCIPRHSSFLSPSTPHELLTTTTAHITPFLFHTTLPPPDPSSSTPHFLHPIPPLPHHTSSTLSLLIHTTLPPPDPSSSTPHYILTMHCFPHLPSLSHHISP